jgi:hypothetical protein
MRGLIALVILSPAFLLAQDQSLATLVLSETPSLDSSPDLAAWRNLHPDEQLKTPAYDNEYESQGLWCAASVAGTRQAFFYVPSSKSGDPLPARPDPNLVQQCRLQALWYEVHDPPDPGSISAELAASLGPATEPPTFKRTDGDWGSGYWNSYLLWQLKNGHLVLAVDQGGPVPDPRARKRLLVIARSSLAPRGLSFDWMGEAPKGQPSLKEAAARLASSDPALSAAMLTPKVSLQTLIQWLEAARGLPPVRKAAALTLADLSVDTDQFGVPDFLTTPAGKRLTELGADIRNGYDGLEYMHSWRSQAEQLDPAGPAGEIARLAHLESACSFEDGHNNWPDGLIQFGEKLLRDSPSNRWTSYVHLTLARTYAASLTLTYPDVELNGANKPTDPDALRRNAILHFRAFLSENPDSPEADVAWREAWRLLAGLPPSPIHFACTD